MKRHDSLKLLSEVRDLQIVDCEGRNCGICDDIEFSGVPGDSLSVKALLVGPGAYSHRLPRWVFRIVKWTVGAHIVRVPWDKVERVTSRIHLSERGETLGLRRIEARLEKQLKRIPSA